MVQKHILHEIQIGARLNIELKVKIQGLEVNVYHKAREMSLVLGANV